MIGRLKQAVRRQQWRPGWWGVLVNPYFLTRRALWRAMAEFAPRLTGKVLDLGCGSQPYRGLFGNAQYVGMELDTEQNRAAKPADVFYDGRTIPFADEWFDGLLCTQVLEHVPTPDGLLAEMRRVLRPGGLLLLTVPFVWEEHEKPWDFARYTSFGVRDLLERNGLDVVEQHRTVPGGRAVVQLAAAAVAGRLRTGIPALNTLVCCLAVAPITLLGMALDAVLPAGPDLYLDNVVLARRRG